MQRVLSFIKTTMLSGIFILLPILLLYLMFNEVLDLINGMLLPIIELLPSEIFDEPQERNQLAVMVLIVTSFIIGFFASSTAAFKLGCWLEKMTLCRLPLYSVIKKITQGFTQKSGTQIKPALLQTFDGVWELVYLVEEHGNGKATLLHPSAPTAFSGPLKIADMSRVQILDISLGDFTNVLSHWGVGSAQLKLFK
jgi:uncharacterized membrane protein